ncbi:sensor histidine kinase [Nonomuraea sp. NPDC050790]|uniref:sensor histidine kinase n=1 Tax=Nonomuraea sp. NPDC050790 TaxID=3364371 RepID=UPI0037875709
MYVLMAVAAVLAAATALFPRLAPASVRPTPESAAVAAGAGSLLVTAVSVVVGGDGGTWPLFAEVPALLVLTLVAARRRPYAALAPGLAVALILLRQVWDGPALLILAACAAWALPAAAAAGAGLYLRWLDQARGRAVAAAVQDQRLALARDLHDFVAHDVSGMLVQAQAAALTPGLPEPVADALRRIEDGGHRALASLDRTVHMLDDRGRAPTPGLERVAELAGGFPPSVRVRFDVAAEGVSREASATAYRVVSEALTNVRRHAPRAAAVEVRVSAGRDRLEVRVQDDGAAGRTDGRRGSSRRGGFGLAGLSELLAAVGGSLEAGPHGDGWRLVAVIPA